MDTTNTIQQMMRTGKIRVPHYQRAYSWDTQEEGKSVKTAHTAVFLSDLNEHIKSRTDEPYYFGHFIFEENKVEDTREIIDGQQRLSTIVMFIRAIFELIDKKRARTQEERKCYSDMVFSADSDEYKFTTVEYDRQLFRDYVIDINKTDHSNLDTCSAKRIVSAFDYFRNELKAMSEEQLSLLLKAVKDATCTTHTVKKESEAIQMFIFENNRGKKPTNLEILKAQFMHVIHLHGGQNKKNMIDDVKGRFGKIYQSISAIDYRINEDEVLLQTLKVHFNNLSETNSLSRIEQILAKDKPCDFIITFSRELATNFDYLKTFFGDDEKSSLQIHSLISLGGLGIAIPFILKSYRFALPLQTKGQLCEALEQLLFRNRIIGTRADITTRINEVFKQFSAQKNDISPIVELVNKLKSTQDWWWAYWNDQRLEEVLRGLINRNLAKHILWKYENHLIAQVQGGYAIRYSNITKPELEHIAPQTEPNQKPHGYDTYDEDFINNHLDSLGNYLILSKTHNASASNDPFPTKQADYKILQQQLEVVEMVKNSQQNDWNRSLIEQRRQKIAQFVLAHF
jgi:hypothetical protein